MSSFVNAILAFLGMAIVFCLGIYKLVATPGPDLVGLLIGVLLVVTFIVVLGVLYAKKPAVAWPILILGIVSMTVIGGPYLMAFATIGFCVAFSKFGCLTSH